MSHTVLRHHGKTILDGFTSIAETIESCEESPLTDKIEQLAVDLVSEGERFQLWAANLGLFVIGDRSLDYRTRDNSSVKEHITKLLVELEEDLSRINELLSKDFIDSDDESEEEEQVELEEYNIEGTGPETESETQDKQTYNGELDTHPSQLKEEGDTEFQQFEAAKAELDDVVDIIDRLYRLASKLRSTTARNPPSSRNFYRDSYQDPDNDGVEINREQRSELREKAKEQTKQFYYRRIKEIVRQSMREETGNPHQIESERIKLGLPDENFEGDANIYEQLQRRLKLDQRAKAVIRRIAIGTAYRQQQFIFWREREWDRRNLITQQRLQQTSEVVKRQMSKADQNSKSDGKPDLEISNKQIPTSSGVPSQTWKMPKGTNLLLPDETRSQTSISEHTATPTIYEPGGKKVGWPIFPKELEGKKDFICPYCFVTCPNKYRGKKHWRLHLIQDLQPYTCTALSCLEGDNNPLNSWEDWLVHEQVYHRMKYHCPEYTSIFSNRQQYVDHIEDNHSDKHPKPEELDQFAQMSLKPTDSCPLCSYVTDTWSDMDKHIGFHLETLALLALPLATGLERHEEEIGSYQNEASQNTVKLESVQDDDTETTTESESSGPDDSAELPSAGITLHSLAELQEHTISVRMGHEAVVKMLHDMRSIDNQADRGSNSDLEIHTVYDTDDGFHTDNEEGFARSDDDYEGDSDYDWWTPGQGKKSDQSKHIHLRSKARRGIIDSESSNQIHNPTATKENFVRSYMAPYDNYVSTITNSFTSLSIANDLSIWLNDEAEFKKATNGKSHKDVFRKWSHQPWEDIELHSPGYSVVEEVETKDHIHSRLLESRHIIAKSAVPSYSYIGELNGQIRGTFTYKKESRAWESLLHPEPFVFFHNDLPVCIDTRTQGSELRFVRRSCTPNASLEIFIVDQEYHFCIMSRKDFEIPAGQEITIPLSFDAQFLLLMLTQDEKSILPEKAAALTSYILNLKANFGGSACKRGDSCLLDSTLAWSSKQTAATDSEASQKCNNISLTDVTSSEPPEEPVSGDIQEAHSALESLIRLLPASDVPQTPHPELEAIDAAFGLLPKSVEPFATVTKKTWEAKSKEKRKGFEEKARSSKREEGILEKGWDVDWNSYIEEVFDPISGCIDNEIDQLFSIIDRVEKLCSSIVAERKNLGDNKLNYVQASPLGLYEAIRPLMRAYERLHDRWNEKRKLVSERDFKHREKVLDTLWIKRRPYSETTKAEKQLDIEARQSKVARYGQQLEEANHHSEVITALAEIGLDENVYLSEEIMRYVRQIPEEKRIRNDKLHQTTVCQTLENVKTSLCDLEKESRNLEEISVDIKVQQNAVDEMVQRGTFDIDDKVASEGTDLEAIPTVQQKMNNALGLLSHQLRMLYQDGTKRSEALKAELYKRLGEVDSIIQLFESGDEFV